MILVSYSPFAMKSIVEVNKEGINYRTMVNSSIDIIGEEIFNIANQFEDFNIFISSIEEFADEIEETIKKKDIDNKITIHKENI